MNLGTGIGMGRLLQTSLMAEGYMYQTAADPSISKIRYRTL